MADSPTREEIYDAIRNADKAGDSAAVQRLGQYLGEMDQPEVVPVAAPAAPQYDGWARQPLRVGSALVKGATGLLGLPGTIGDAATRGLNLLTGGPSPEEVRSRLDTSLGGHVPGFPTVSDLHAPLESAGVVNNPALAPQGWKERYADAGVEAVPAIAASIATGGAALPMILSGEAGALSGQGAHDLAPESTWAPVVAGLVSGLGVGGTASTVENALNARNVEKTVNTTAAALGPAASKLEAARDAAFAGRKALADHVAEVRAASQRDFDVTKTTLGADLAAAHAGHDATIGRVAGELGDASTFQQAGETLQQQARDWITKTLPAKLEAQWAPVNAAIPKDSAVNLANFSQALQEINTSAGKLEPLAALLKPGAPKALGKALEAVTGAGELGIDAPSDLAQGLHSWGDVQKLRSTLGDAMSNPRVVADVGGKNLERLYATITADMRTTAQGQGAGALFDAANAESRRLYQIGEGPMSRVVAGPRPSAEDPAPEAVAKSLLASGRGGASDLATLANEIPGGLSQLAAAHLRLDPKGFAKLSPEAVRVLFSRPGQAEEVSGALAGKEAATAAHAEGLALAARAKAANVEAIKKAQAESNWDHAAELRSSAKELKAAKDAHAAALTAKAGLPGNSLLDHSGTSIAGLLMGEEIGRAIDPLLLKGMGLGAPGGAIVGALAPKAIRGAVNFLRPKSAADIAPPLLGASAAANALYGPRQ